MPTPQNDAAGPNHTEAEPAPVPAKGTRFAAGSGGALALGAFALGALTMGAVAVGFVAIGRLSIGRLRIRDAQIDRLRIGSVDKTSE